MGRKKMALAGQANSVCPAGQFMSRRLAFQFLRCRFGEVGQDAVGPGPLEGGLLYT